MANGTAIISGNDIDITPIETPIGGLGGIILQGIQVIRTSNVTVNGNNITYNGNYELFGAGITGYLAPNCAYVGNTVSTEFTTGSDGIFITSSLNSALVCNTTEGLKNGMAFYDNSDASVVSFNRFNKCKGPRLYLAGDAVIGAQIKRGNGWNGITNSGLEAQFETTDPDRIHMSRFQIHNYESYFPNNGWWAQPRDPAADWFIGPPEGNEFLQVDCSIGPSPGDDESARLSTANQLSIAGAFPAYKGYPASAWEAQLNAFNVLDSHAALLDSTGAYQFYQTHLNGKTGMLARASKTLQDIEQMPEAMQSQWESHRSSVASLLQQRDFDVIERFYEFLDGIDQ